MAFIFKRLVCISLLPFSVRTIDCNTRLQFSREINAYPKLCPFTVFTTEAQCTAILDSEWVECETDTSLQKLYACN
jgi:hypothetical protein